MTTTSTTSSTTPPPTTTSTSTTTSTTTIPIIDPIDGVEEECVVCYPEVPSTNTPPPLSIPLPITIDNIELTTNPPNSENSLSTVVTTTPLPIITTTTTTTTSIPSPILPIENVCNNCKYLKF